MADNVKITSAVYGNAAQTLVIVLLATGETWVVIPNNGSGQANVLAAWLAAGGQIGPYVPPLPGVVVKPGTLIWYASNRLPVGYLLCDGQAISRLQYPALFKTIGTRFGAGDQSKTFNLPDLRSQVIRGWTAANGLDPDRVFGSKQESRIGKHRHSITDGGHTHDVNDPGHVHEVDDPGHTHGGDDPGHTHALANPDHSHQNTLYEIGYAVAFVPVAHYAYTECMTLSEGYPQGLTDYASTDIASAKLTATPTSANLRTDFANANVSDLVNVTGITVNPAVTNIVNTEEEGGAYSRPYNLSLLPLIKY